MFFCSGKTGKMLHTDYSLYHAKSSGVRGLHGTRCRHHQRRLDIFLRPELLLHYFLWKISLCCVNGVIMGGPSLPYAIAHLTGEICNLFFVRISYFYLLCRVEHHLDLFKVKLAHRNEVMSAIFWSFTPLNQPEPWIKFSAFIMDDSN